ncbi:hypothetical protein ALI22I_07640 [Saccharothrix sp. ALI-22-I]|uniref:hypothetical protein n=1 Tax=Saccharothrix sp. ALI-22-I TaxID=1933778 RepID=UPI00097BC1DB|nr:hypothetical protein [Saccharothrix sp. ALI-22-I]ONI91731.1 hypothetical protein ALI22I_07640 [Saccharothrix sp. ALI-22-I]
MASTDNDQDSLLSEITLVAGRVRHPDLWIGAFVAPAWYGDAEIDDSADEKDVEAALPADERERARRRRGTLLVAANRIIDDCISDLTHLGFDDTGLPDADDAEDSVVYRFFPPRHRDAYDEDFFRQVLVTAVKVAHDLADPHGRPAACTAEEVIRDTVLDLARDLCLEADLGAMPPGVDDLLLEDTDFEVLFRSDMDGIEDDPGLQAGMNLTVGGVQDWFVPFRPGLHPHPYVEAVSTAPLVHDLRRRLPCTEFQDVAGPSYTGFDLPDPVVRTEPESEIVALARESADRDDPALWVPDDHDHEKSFAALQAAAARADAGSGWLTWEPYEGADTVRTDPVIMLVPHRHFPVGPDEPWVDTAIAPHGRLLAVPLRVIVSYRPDSDVRRQWTRSLDTLPQPQI